MRHQVLLYIQSRGKAWPTEDVSDSNFRHLTRITQETLSFQVPWHTDHPLQLWRPDGPPVLSKAGQATGASGTIKGLPCPSLTVCGLS